MKRSHLLPMLGGLAACLVSHGHAQSASEPLNLFGQLGQGNAAVNGTQAVKNNACVTTSVANGLTFLENYSNFVLDEPSPFSVSPNNYAAVNALIAAMDTDEEGTGYADKYNGLQSYLSATGANPAPTVKILGQASPQSKGGVPVVNAGIDLQGVIPSVAFLVTALDNHDAVELGLQWGSFSGAMFTSKGGHSVTLDGITYNAAGNYGTLDIIDPWGTSLISTNAGSAAGDYDLPFTITNGYIYLTYPTTVADGAGQDGNLPTEAGNVFASGETARILNDVVEALPAVPDQTATLPLLALAAFALCLWRVQGSTGGVAARDRLAD